MALKSLSITSRSHTLLLIAIRCKQMHKANSPSLMRCDTKYENQHSATVEAILLFSNGCSLKTSLLKSTLQICFGGEGSTDLR